MDEAVLELYAKEPLLAFSPLTQFHVRILLTLSTEITEMLSATLGKPRQIDSVEFTRMYGLLWLWILGAFEVVSVMSKAQGCFSESAKKLIEEQKRSLVKLRAPLSKQEYAGQRVPSGLDGMLSGIDFETKDVSFSIGGEVTSARSVLSSFEALISSIHLADIKAPHRARYEKVS